jgi:decaheme cytochrome c component MtrC/MtrF-like protein
MTQIKQLLVILFLMLICVHPRLSAADYSKFSHSTKKHQAACNTCHKVPTKDWTRASAYPDITDYPSHEACVSCHRPQFFRSARPPICSVCHSKTSPRDDVRYAFRNPATKLQFTIEFPHDRHQDAIALLRFSHAPQSYNNCTICHAPRTTTFKAAPTSHGSCFNCHWKSQEPVAANCNGCHKLATTPYVIAEPVRISAKFIHDGGGEKKQHVAECTTCHINITKATSLRGLKPDVPITACTECHNKDGLRQDLNKELMAIDKNRGFTCVYCHSPNVGNLDPPASHYLIAERPPMKRKDVK